MYVLEYYFSFQLPFSAYSFGHRQAKPLLGALGPVEKLPRVFHVRNENSFGELTRS